MTTRPGAMANFALLSGAGPGTSVPPRRATAALAPLVSRTEFNEAESHIPPDGRLTRSRFGPSSCGPAR